MRYASMCFGGVMYLQEMLILSDSAQKPNLKDLYLR